MSWVELSGKFSFLNWLTQTEAKKVCSKSPLPTCKMLTILSLVSNIKWQSVSVLIFDMGRFLLVDFCFLCCSDSPPAGCCLLLPVRMSVTSILGSVRLGSKLWSTCEGSMSFMVWETGLPIDDSGDSNKRGLQSKSMMQLNTVTNNRGRAGVIGTKFNRRDYETMLTNEIIMTKE